MVLGNINVLPRANSRNYKCDFNGNCGRSNYALPQYCS